MLQTIFFSKQRKMTFFFFQGAVSFTSEVRGESRLMLYVLHCSYISALYSQTEGPVSYSENKLTLGSYLEQGHGTQKVVFH